VLFVLGIEHKACREQRISDIASQLAKRATRWRCSAHDLEINILRHALGELVSAAQRRAAAEHKTEVASVNGGNRRERLDDVPILFDQPRTREAEVLLNLKQLLNGWLIVQGPAPNVRSAGDARSGPSPEPQD
jgi:hypothetical protein